jgi:hypothetical protein
MAGDMRTFVPHAAVAGAFSVITVGLVVWALQRPYGRPQDTFDRCVARYATGTLTTDDAARQCGQDALRPAIKGAGRASYDEIVAIYDRASRLGMARLNETTGAADKAGRAAFATLPWNEQNRIKGAGKQAFVYSHGLRALSADEQALVSDTSVLLDPSKRDALVRTLGERAANGAAPAAGARTRAGTLALTLLTLKVERAGNAAFNALARDERQEVEERSLNEYIAREGFARLGDADKTAVGRPEVLMDRAAKSARAATLGRDLLEPADKARLPNKTQAEFAAARDEFTEAEGRRIVGNRLLASMKDSRPNLEIEGYSGTVVAWSAATGAVRWRGIAAADAAGLLGSRARFERRGNAWTMDWR